MPSHHHSFGRESLITGLLGAGVVALWFLAIDALAGHPFTTPSILGQVIVFRQDTPETAPVVWLAVAAYTALHLAAFLLIGALVTKMVFLADRNGVFRFALLMLFFAFEVMFYGFLLMFFQSTAGQFPIWSVLMANTAGRGGNGLVPAEPPPGHSPGPEAASRSAPEVREGAKREGEGAVGRRLAVRLRGRGGVGSRGWGATELLGAPPDCPLPLPRDQITSTPGRAARQSALRLPPGRRSCRCSGR